MPDGQIGDVEKERASNIADREIDQSNVIHTIQDDMEAYFHRKQDLRYKKVLDQMYQSGAVAEIS